jgi:hypothetical protein
MEGEGAEVPADMNSREEVAAFIADFEAPRLSRQQWTHHAHLTAGYWYLMQHGPTDALDRLRRNIRAHNESVGTPNTDTSGYHESISRLYLAGIQAHIAAHRELSFEDSLQRLLASGLGQSAWPLTYYSRERLFSVAARRGWVEPDLQSMERLST